MASVACVTIPDKPDAPNFDPAMIEELCQELDYHWREGKLGPCLTLELFAWQIQAGNVSCDAVRHHANGAFSSEAYCMARGRLPLKLLAALSKRIAERTLAKSARTREHRWHGRRVYRVDGTGLQLPDTPEVRKHFGCSARQKPGCGFPTMHLLLLTGPGGAAIDAICSPLTTGDLTHVSDLHPRLRAGDVVLGDVMFGAWGHLHLLQSQRIDGVFPAHQSRKIGWGAKAEHGPSRRFVKSLGYRDQLVEYRKPQQKPKWMTQREFDRAPQWIRVREIRRVVKVGSVRREVVVVTTLLDPRKYPAKAVVKLLAQRWLIETQLKALKTTMGMERLRCKGVEGVQKEVLMYLIVYNLLRLLVLEAAKRQKVDAGRISLADALARRRYGTLSGWVNLEIVPERPGREEPRVVKTRPKAFAKMARPRDVLRAEIRLKRQKAKQVA